VVARGALQVIKAPLKKSTNPAFCGVCFFICKMLTSLQNSEISRNELEVKKIQLFPSTMMKVLLPE
jgi:hypothetical protein